MYRSLMGLSLMIFVALGIAVPGRSRAQDDRLCFNVPGITNCIEGRFRQFWEQNGGLPVFGYPITPARQEVNADTGRSHLTQWFERNRFELHPELAAPYDVLLGRLGAEVLEQVGRDWRAEGRESGPRDGCVWFEETGHNVCNQSGAAGFKHYWESHGLQDPRLNAYQRSLALFGLPLTAPRMETNASGDTVLTQWFERARFEWHSGNPAPYRVLLGLLGHEARVPLVRTQNPGLPGRLLVYVDALYIVEADGGQVTRLPIEFATGGGFAIAPDGPRVATRCVHDGATGLCTMDLNGRNITRLNNDPAVTVYSWSPDGSRIAYESGSDERRGLHVINANGSGDILLMAGTPGLMQAGASWSPDGRQIAFNTIFAEQAIYVVNADGTQLRRIVPHGEAPRWSPDGARIAFESEINGSPDIYVVNPDGSGLARLTTSTDAEGNPAWSPDGARIAYHWTGAVAPNPAGSPTGIFVMAADGSNKLEVLHSEPTYSFNAFAWSPDGNYIAAGRACPRLCGPGQILGASADGSRRFTLVTGEPPSGGAALVDWLRKP